MKLSDIVRNYRLEKDISQREFAKRCGLSNSYISFIENECNPKTGRPMVPTIEQYKKIADGMSISVQHLFELLDKDAPVILNNPESSYMNLQLFSDGKPPDVPVTTEARILAKGIDKLPQEQRELALSVIRAMFTKYADYFDKENDDDT